MTLAQLKRRVSRAMVREDIDPEEMAAWVASGTARINQELRSNDMLQRASVPLTGATVTAPPRFLSVKTMRLTRGQFGPVGAPLSATTPEQIAGLAAGWAHDYPGFYASFGREFELAPYRPDPTLALDLWFYAAVPALTEDTDTNFILTKYPDLYLNAVCVYAHRFYLEMDQALLRDGLVSQEIQRLHEVRDAEKYGDGPLFMQPARRLGGRFS